MIEKQEVVSSNDNSIETVRARKTIAPDFLKKPENPNSYGLIFEPYTQPEEIGLSVDSVREARDTKALKDRVVVVVGAGLNGIGGASLIEAALQGATVVGVSRKSSDHPEVSELMNNASEISGVDSLWIPADITKEDSSKKIIEETLEKFGKIDGMVIAPAIIDDKPYTDYEREDFRRLFEVNFESVNWLMLDTLSVMKDQKEGKIVFVSSVSASGTPRQAPYASAKAGMEAIIRGLPLELIRYRGKVAANALASGFVAETGLTGAIAENGLSRILEFSLAERPLLAGEVAEGILHLLNPNTQANGKVVPMVGRGQAPAVDKFGATIR